MGNNLRSLRKSRRWTLEEAAEKFGMSRSGYIKLEDREFLRMNHVQTAAALYGVSEAEIIGGPFGEAPPSHHGEDLSPGHFRLVPVTHAGTVEAGAFRQVDDFQEHERITLWEPEDERFPNVRMEFFDVAGDSMNNLKPRPIFPGDRVICVALADINIPLRDGMVVVVEQVLAGGHVRERSVKQLELYDDRVEFHPRSTNPRHKPIVVKKDLHADDGRTVEILALVRRVTNDIPY